MPPFLLPAAAVAALLFGFVDLVRGGITVSAILLALGYCVLVPLWIWRTPAPAAPPPRRQTEVPPPSYLAATGAAAAVLVLYLLTLAPTTAMWDTSEYITAAYTFGLPHPPGNPFFVIIGRVFSILPIAGTVAVRINILAALSSAAAAGMWFLVTERVLAEWVEHRWQRIAGGALAVLIGATAFTTWNQSVVNEKVYTVSLAGIAIVSWLALRWAEDPRAPKADRMLVMIAYLCGLGYANHMAGMLPAPAVIAAILLRDPRTLVRGRLVAACAGALLLGLTPFATQPIRAAYRPPVNEGAPTACRDTLQLSCTFSKGTYDAFMYNLSRKQYSKPPLAQRQAPLTAQVGLWWLYFRWQWLRDVGGTQQGLQAMLAGVFLFLGFLGGYEHWRRDRKSFAFFGPLMFLTTLALIFYLNFKYGASQSPQLGPSVPREVRDRDYFYLWSFSAWSVWAALGLTAVWRWIATKVGAETTTRGGVTTAVPLGRSWIVTSPILLIAAFPLVGNWSAASRHTDTVARDFAKDLLNSVEPYGVLVVVGDNDTFPLWYAQEVEGVRKDVVVANTSLLGTDWYARQMITRPIYEYDAAAGPAIYRGREWVKPTTDPLNMSQDAADSIPEYYPGTDPFGFESHGLKTTVNPRDLDYGVVTRADVFVLRIIQQAWPARPVYFSRSAGPYPSQLGLGKNVLAQGLALKVVLLDSAQTRSMRDTVQTANGLLDVACTYALWRDVFVGPQAVIARGMWVDEPSVTIPNIEVVTGAELGQVLGGLGRRADADSVFLTALKMARVTNLPGAVATIQSMRAEAGLKDSAVPYPLSTPAPSGRPPTP